MTAYAWTPTDISYAGNFRWCQEHGHTGLLADSVCDISDRLVKTDPALAATVRKRRRGRQGRAQLAPSGLSGRQPAREFSARLASPTRA